MSTVFTITVSAQLSGLWRVRLGEYDESSFDAPSRTVREYSTRTKAGAIKMAQRWSKEYDNAEILGL